jgi:hypothetical protein
LLMGWLYKEMVTFQYITGVGLLLMLWHSTL